MICSNANKGTARYARRRVDEFILHRVRLASFLRGLEEREIDPAEMSKRSKECRQRQGRTVEILAWAFSPVA